MRIRVVSRAYIYINNDKVNSFYPACGYSRDLYRYGDIIIKMDWDECGQSYQEIQLWNMMKDEEKKYFVEPLDYGYILEDNKKIYWVSQRMIATRHISKKDVLYHKDYKQVRNIERKYSLCDCAYNDDNFGLDINNNIKIWDYGV